MTCQTENMMCSLFVGIEVIYRGYHGFVRFIDEDYVTICIKEHPHNKMRDVCLVVPPNYFDEIHLIKESEK